VRNDRRLLLLDLRLSLDGLAILVLLAEKSTKDAGTLAGLRAGLVLCLLGGLLFVGRGAGGGSSTRRGNHGGLSGNDSRLGLSELGTGVHALLGGGRGSAC
jgi:hypothetical protein